uniref:PROP1-like PPR domain-containing protein n=1 Tax=Kalanchoe fedtschenkoi TaxID=63787 RepID=A0A7N0TJN6_KALFE
MWCARKRQGFRLLSVLLRSGLNSMHVDSGQNGIFTNLGKAAPEAPNHLMSAVMFCSVRSGSCGGVEERRTVHMEDEDGDGDERSEDDDELGGGEDEVAGGRVAHDVEKLMSIFKDSDSDLSEKRRKLTACDGVGVSSKLVSEVLGSLRNDWESAFMFFLWAGKQPGYKHSTREYHSMIYILGKMRKFDTAWSLVDEMSKVKDDDGSSLVTQHTLLILIRRYCAVHDVGKAISTFHAHKRFKFDAGIEEFQNLLSALSRYKNMKDAEHLLYCNKDIYPFCTKSFNIILNGWCSVGSPREAERCLKEMSKRRIPLDVITYASLISCYAKLRNMRKVWWLFDQLKKSNIEPDRKVYNAVISALARNRYVPQARQLIQTMEEKGIAPDVVTYNSIYMPLCKMRKANEARDVFNEMLQRGLSPTLPSYHALFRILRTSDEVFLLLETMKEAGCNPNSDTYIMLIRKLCRWRQVDDVRKLWSRMFEDGISPDRSSYIVLIHGLFLNGKLEEANKFYAEMKEKLIRPEPMLDELLQAWESGRQQADYRNINAESKEEVPEQTEKRTVPAKNHDEERDLRRFPEIRKVVRQGGFSFWQ